MCGLRFTFFHTLLYAERFLALDGPCSLSTFDSQYWSRRFNDPELVGTNYEERVGTSRRRKGWFDGV